MAFTERSRRSRDAVLGAARLTFAERGFERTTVRDVAGLAGVDPSMVMRYFTSKDGLFSAAVDIDLELPDLRAVESAERGAALARHVVAQWEDPVSGPVLSLLLRSATTHEVAADRLRVVFSDQVTVLVARLRSGRSTPSAADRRRAGEVATLVLGLALTRYVLRLPPLVALSGEEVVGLLGPQLQQALSGLR